MGHDVQRLGKHSLDWWNFCRAFNEEDEDESLLRIVNDYREQVMKYNDLFGIKEMIYVDDQGSFGYLEEFVHNWDFIVNELNTKFKNTTINTSEFMKHKKPLPRDEYPLAFYDDFAD